MVRKTTTHIAAACVLSLVMFGVMAAPAAASSDIRSYWTSSLSKCLSWQSQYSSSSFTSIVQACHKSGNGYKFRVAFRTH